ncbi:OCIA domain-containing protein 1 [Dendroctonus ponderosae]
MMRPTDEPERQTPFPGPNARQPPPPYKFTPEELRVLRECNRESFYNRCLPMSAIFGGLTYYGIHTGIFNRNKAFGATPKVVAAVVVGFFIGKLSYQRNCADKFVALPNSKIGKMIKARRLGVADEEDDSQFSFSSLSPFTGLTDNYSDITPDTNQSYDYDNKPTPQGLDDAFRPSMDNPIILHEEEMPPEQKHVTTYEELRKKNREEYEQKRAQNYRHVQPKAPPSPPSTSRESEFSDDPYKPSSPAPKTKYGDVWG